MLQTFRLDIEYEGTEFLGWQRQPEGRTVQGVVENALGRIFGEIPSTLGAGRTDAGVHAKGQVVRFSIDSDIPLKGLALRMNQLLPRDVAVTRAWRVSQDFHPRYSATSKFYRYHFFISQVPAPLQSRMAWHIRPPVDLDLMDCALPLLAGEHNFLSFSCSEGSQRSSVRTLMACRIEPGHSPGTWVVSLQATGFLNRMARMMVGTLVEIGKGRRSLEDIPHLLNHPRVGSAGPPAPACGLCLEEVIYPPPWDAPDPHEVWP